MRELDEVAGVEPATLEIDRPVYGRQGVPDDDVAVRILVGRPVVDLQRAVMQVSGLAVERSGDHLRPVALRLEERHRVGNPGQEEGARRSNAEGRRGRRQRVTHRQAVGPRLVERAEVQLMDCPIPTIPSTLGPAHPAAQHDVAIAVADLEQRSVDGGGGKQVAQFPLAGEVAQLIDANGAPRAGRGVRRNPMREARGSACQYRDGPNAGGQGHDGGREGDKPNRSFRSQIHQPSPSVRAGCCAPAPSVRSRAPVVLLMSNHRADSHVVKALGQWRRPAD